MAKTLFSVVSQVVGIHRNENADAVAKSALSLPVTLPTHSAVNWNTKFYVG